MEDSVNSLVTLTVKLPVWLIAPAKIISPSLTLLGTDSPVSAEVSI